MSKTNHDVAACRIKAKTYYSQHEMNKYFVYVLYVIYVYNI